jgi:N-acetylglutamate synthase-like GNAT family acetyltransferase
MNNDITIRVAQKTDIEDLVTLRKLLLSTGTGHYVAKNNNDESAWQLSYRNWLNEKINNVNNTAIIVGQCHDSLVISGCAIGIIDDRAPMPGCLNGKMGWIQALAVHPKDRRKKVAMTLMDFLLSWFKHKLVNKIALQTTDDAKELYSLLGFLNSGEDLLIKKFN